MGRDEYLEELKLSIRENGKLKYKDEKIRKLVEEKKKLKGEINLLQNQLNIMQAKQDQMETILDSLGVKDNFDDFIKFITFLYENKEDFFNYIKYKNEFVEFLNIKKNNNNIINEIDINNNQDYIYLKNINDENNEKIMDLESKIAGLTSNIDDNVLFKKLKEQNVLLSENNKTLNIENDEIKQRLKKLEENDNINKEDVSIDIESKINEALEKQKVDLYKDFSIEREETKKEYELNYSNKFLGLNKTIESLNSTISDLKNNNEKLLKEMEKLKSNKIKKENEKTKKDIYCIENLYDSITIYTEMEKPWQMYASSFTYDKFKKMSKFDYLINEDNDVDKETYIEVINWLNDKPSLIKYGNKTKFSYHYKRKLKRIVDIYNKYEDKLINVNINTSYLGKMSDKVYNQWIDILDKKINQKKNKISDNININVNDNTNNKIPKKCGNFGYGCNNFVTNRSYCQECIDDGYNTTDNESDD